LKRPFAIPMQNFHHWNQQKTLRLSHLWRKRCTLSWARPNFEAYAPWATTLKATTLKWRQGPLEQALCLNIITLTLGIP
jgi:hypothetical protein